MRSVPLRSDRTDGSDIPLSAFPLLRSRDIDSIVNRLQPILGLQVAELPDGGAIDARANCCGLSATAIWCCDYGAPVTLKFPEVDYFRLQFAHRGRGATTVNGRQVPVTAQTACVTSTPMQIDYGGDFAQLAARINMKDLVHKLTALTGSQVSHRLEYDPVLDLALPENAHLQRTLAFVVQSLDATAHCPPLVLAELEQALMVSFLCAGRHNYSHLLQRRPSSAAPWQVRRAEEYIEANWNRPISVEDIAAVTGASARSIFRAFRQSRGYSPMSYARQVRLRHAQRLLELSDSTTMVTDVAYACGFSDLSRFSKDYLRTFGELPSHVLNRCRGTAPSRTVSSRQ